MNARTISAPASHEVIYEVCLRIWTGRVKPGLPATSAAGVSPTSHGMASGRRWAFRKSCVFRSGRVWGEGFLHSTSAKGKKVADAFRFSSTRVLFLRFSFSSCIVFARLLLYDSGYRFSGSTGIRLPSLLVSHGATSHTASVALARLRIQSAYG